MNNTFTEDIIKHYLDDKLYEKRGITKDEYVARCKSIWEKTICEDDGFKIIIDGLFDYSKLEDRNDYNDKLVTNHLKNKLK
jgi:hypothetical protein